MIGELMGNLGALDYPAEKLEILVLLESDDTETIEAARAARPPATVRLVIVPDAAPKTKPKACNVGLLLARGELLVIYDAEDRPDPDQLRKAVAAFEQAGPQTVCMQARLRYWNSSANLLTRMFSLEYGYWFGTMLPGSTALACRSRSAAPPTTSGSPRFEACSAGILTTSPRTPTSGCGRPWRATASA